MVSWVDSYYHSVTHSATDASGVAVLIQAFTILNKYKWTGTRAVEFHAYGVSVGQTSISLF
jgi:hypothetical protein